MIKLNAETLVTGIICVNFFSIGLYGWLLKNRSYPLVIFCLALGVNQLYDLLTFNAVYGTFLKYLDEVSLLVAFPALYYYVKPGKWNWVHLIPIVLLPIVAQIVVYPFFLPVLALIYIVAMGRKGWPLAVILFFWVLSILGQDPYNLTGLTLLVFSYWLGYHIIVRKGVSYKNSTLSAQQQLELAAQIKDFMAAHKPYLNNELTLTMLSSQLNLKPGHLSQILNVTFKANFYSFINHYRVEESKRLLVDPNYAHYSILGIALEAGFNSKTTFNKAFKETTGLAPSEYVRLGLDGRPAIA